MINISKLSNGITVVTEVLPYMKSSAFGVWVRVGSANETKENNGIAHVIEHMLFKGTKSRDAKQIADEMAMIGGNINAFTSKECTSYYSSTLSEHLPIAIDIISDMIANSLVDEDSLKKEKRVIIEEIDMYDDSPEDLVHEMLQEAIWEKHPLGYLISGSKKTVRKMTREQILDFIDTYYVGDNMIISIAGQFDETEILGLLEEKFAVIKPSSSKPKQMLTKPEYHQVKITRQKDIEQAHINIAFEGTSYLAENRFTFSILNSVLGSSINSRLFQKIRENSGLTYSIYSYGSSYREAGLIHIYAAMNPSQINTVMKKIKNIIKDVKKNGLTEDEIRMTKEQLKTEIILGNESGKSRMNSNAKGIMNRGRITPIETIIDQINQVTFEDVKAYANQYFDWNKASISIVGNVDESSIIL